MSARPYIFPHTFIFHGTYIATCHLVNFFAMLDRKDASDEGTKAWDMCIQLKERGLLAKPTHGESRGEHAKIQKQKRVVFAVASTISRQKEGIHMMSRPSICFMYSLAAPPRACYPRPAFAPPVLLQTVPDGCDRVTPPSLYVHLSCDYIQGHARAMLNRVG